MTPIPAADLAVIERVVGEMTEPVLRWCGAHGYRPEREDVQQEAWTLALEAYAAPSRRPDLPLAPYLSRVFMRLREHVENWQAAFGRRECRCRAARPDEFDEDAAVEAERTIRADEAEAERPDTVTPEDVVAAAELLRIARQAAPQAVTVVERPARLAVVRPAPKPRTQLAFEFAHPVTDCAPRSGQTPNAVYCRTYRANRARRKALAALSGDRFSVCAGRSV